MKSHGSKFTGHLIFGSLDPVAKRQAGVMRAHRGKKKGLAVRCNRCSTGVGGLLNQIGTSLGI